MPKDASLAYFIFILKFMCIVMLNTSTELMSAAELMSDAKSRKWVRT